MASDRIAWAGLYLNIEGGKEFKNKLRDINQELKLSQTNLSKVTNAFGKNERNTQTLTAQKQHLEESIRLNKERIEELNKALQSANNQYGENSREVLALKTSLSEAEAQQVSLERALRETENALKAQPWLEAGEKIQTFGNRVTDVGKKLQSVGKTLSVAVTAPLLAIGTASVKVGADYETSMNKIQARSRMTADDIDRLGSEFREMALSGDYGVYTAREIANAFSEVATAGDTVEHSTDLMRASMVLATATGYGLSNSAYFLGNYLLKVGKDASHAEKYMNMFAAINQKTGIGLSTLQDYLFRSNVTLQATNISGAEASAMFGKLYQAGIRGAQAYSGVENALRSLLTPTQEQINALERLGVAREYENGQLRDGIPFLFDVADALSSLEGAQLSYYNQLLGSTAMGSAFLGGMVDIKDTLPDAIADIYEAAEAIDGTGRAFEMAAIQQDGLAARVRQLRVVFEELKLQIADILIPYVERFVEIIGNLINRFANLDDQTQKTIVKFAVIAAAIGPFLIVLGKVVTAIGSITTAFGKLVTFIGKSGGLIATLAKLKLAFNPVTLAIGAAVSAGVFLYKNWETVKEKADALWQFLEPTFDAIRNFFTAWGKEVGEKFSELFTAIKELGIEVFTSLKVFWERWGDTITTLFSGVWNNIKIIVTTAFELIKSVINTSLDIITAVIETFTAVLQGDWQGVWDGIRDIVSGAWYGIKDAVNIIVEGITGIFSNTVSTMISIGIDIMQGLINGITSMASAVWDSVTDIASGIASRITGFFGINSPSRLMIKYFRDVGQGMIVGLNSKSYELLETSDEISDKVAKSLSVDIDTLMSNYKMVLEVIKENNAYRKYLADDSNTEINDINQRANSEKLRNLLKFNGDMISALEGHQNELTDLVSQTTKEEAFILEDGLQRQIQLRLDIINRHIQAVQDSTHAIILEYDKQHQALMQSLDYSENESIRALQNRLDAIDSQTEAENRALREQQDQRRLADLQSAIDKASTDEERIRATERFNEELQRQQREALLQARREEQDSLREQIQEIRQNYQERRDEAKEQHNASVEQARENERKQLEFLNSLQRIEQENFNNRQQQLDQYLKTKQDVITRNHREQSTNQNKHNSEIETSIADSQSNIVDTLNRYTPKWGESGNAAGSAFLEAIQNMIPEVENMGASLSQGVANGIINNSGVVTNAAQHIIEQAISVMKATAQVNSPSRKTMFLGQNLMDGLTLGLKSKTGELERVCKNIVDTISNSLYSYPYELIKVQGHSINAMKYAVPSLESNIKSNNTPQNESHTTSNPIYNINMGGTYHVRQDSDIDNIANAVLSKLKKEVCYKGRIGGIVV